MSVRVTIDTKISVSSDERGHKDLGNFGSIVTTDAWNEGGTQKSRIAGGGTVKEIILDDIESVGLLFVRISPTNTNENWTALTLQLNADTGEEITITPVAGKRVGYFLITTSGLNSLFFTNNETISLDIVIIMAGD